MLEKFANIFRIPDLRKRILFTLGLLAVYRLGGHIPTPGVNADKLQQFFYAGCNAGTFPFLKGGNQPDVFRDGKVREQPRVLDYVTDPAAKGDQIPIRGTAALHQSFSARGQ